MNILPKKSWHVRNKDNVARVRRDEAKALEEEREVARRKALADQEARIRVLREKSKVIQQAKKEAQWDLPQEPSDEEEKPEDETEEEQREYKPLNTAFPTDQHINLFEDFEKNKKTQGSNREYEEEKKKAQEAYEKKIGYLTYLGQSASEKLSGKPWYVKVPDRSKEQSEPSRSFCEQETLKVSDPLLSMKGYLEKKKNAEDLFYGRTKEISVGIDRPQPRRRRGGYSRVSTSTYNQSSTGKEPSTLPLTGKSEYSQGKKRKLDSDDESPDKNKKKRGRPDSHEKDAAASSSHKNKKQKKDKKKKSKKHKRSGRKSTTPEPVCNKPTIEQLRAARMRREESEKQRSIDLVSRLQGYSTPARSVIDERSLTYNTRYMPAGRAGKR